MPWVISFIVSWILFFLLVDYKNLKINLIGGIFALALASFVDWGGQKLEFYDFYDVIIPWAGCSAFYKFGPIFTMGTLFSQSVPRKKLMQPFNIIAFTLLYIFLELLILNTHAAEYLQWHVLASILINLLTFSTLTYITITFLQKPST
ncbi:UNVERIFIED_CONTAM: hypothetical protein Cloal_0375 [Acetivibrio alkalicellulosi]